MDDLMDWDALQRKSERDLGPVFIAQYPGTCPSCGEEMLDEDVRFEDGDLKHATCVEEDLLS